MGNREIRWTIFILNYSVWLNKFFIHNTCIYLSMCWNSSCSKFQKHLFIHVLTSCFQVISPAIFVRCTVRSQENGVKHSTCLRTVLILYWQTVKAGRTPDGTVCDVTFVTRLNDVEVKPEVVQLYISFHVLSTICWFE